MGTENDVKPVVDVGDKSITQIGIVVRDASKIAKRYSEIFGIGPWIFFDGTPRD